MGTAALTHECSRRSRQELFATRDEPYNFVDSGLSNVRLIGIRYFRCQCGREIADIPAIKQLLRLIARDLVEKTDSLAGEEIRFLRKRLGEKQAAFAKEIGVRPETLCRMETGETRTNERTDKLIRLYYVLAADDPALDELRQAIKEMMASWKYSEMRSQIVATVRDNEWEIDPAAA